METRKINKRCTDWKGRNLKMIVYKENPDNPKDSTPPPNLLELVSEFSKVTRSRHKKTVVFLYINNELKNQKFKNNIYNSSKK